MDAMYLKESALNFTGLFSHPFCDRVVASAHVQRKIAISGFVENPGKSCGHPITAHKTPPEGCRLDLCAGA